MKKLINLKVFKKMLNKKENISLKTFQNSTKSVKLLVIDAQGVVDTSQSTYIPSFLRSIDLSGSQGLVWPSMKS